MALAVLIFSEGFDLTISKVSNDEPAAISTSKVIDRSISRSALGYNGLNIFIKENAEKIV